jgi:hypothetical protein
LYISVPGMPSNGKVCKKKLMKTESWVANGLKLNLKPIPQQSIPQFLI